MRYREIIVEQMSAAEYRTRRLIKTFNETPQEINNGWCWGFANRLAKILGPEAKVVSTTQMPEVFSGHSIVLFRGKYYDAESPEGVDDPRDLAYSKRMYRFINDDTLSDDYEGLMYGKTKMSESKKDFEREAKPAMIADTPENIAAAKEFVMKKWLERWQERNRNAETWRALAATGKRPDITPDYYEAPSDLTNACKFTSMFAREIFGGSLEGNWNHQYVRSLDGKIIDLNLDASDVKELGARAHKHDRVFWGSREHKESLDSVRPRVSDWVKEFLTNR